FINKMRSAADQDMEANKQGQPGFFKLKMLPDVQSMIERTTHHPIMLDNNLLGAIKSWLEPLPDSSLPSYTIRHAMFEILNKLPIETDHLRESGIGRVIVFYSKCEREEKDIRAKARELISMCELV
ncbi:hypothetical protein BKA69DRAFT_1028633, partial [Paraphysoderma sedebokerense]